MVIPIPYTSLFLREAAEVLYRLVLPCVEQAPDALGNFSPNYTLFTACIVFFSGAIAMMASPTDLSHEW